MYETKLALPKGWKIQSGKSFHGDRVDIFWNNKTRLLNLSNAILKDTCHRYQLQPYSYQKSTRRLRPWNNFQNYTIDFLENLKQKFKGFNLLTGLLIFRVVVEPWISGKSVKSRGIHKNTRNPTKFPKNLTKYMSPQHIWKLSSVGCWGCLLAVNLLIYRETLSVQRVNNIPKLPGILKLKPRRS